MRWAIPRFSNLAASDIQTRILGGPMFRIIAGSARAVDLKRGATRALLLASTTLATGIFAGAMVNPQTAQASCTDFPQLMSNARTYAWLDVSVSTPVVTCGITTTINNT